ncbi:MAG: phage integrase N-terminal SAM-like domain-containing protein [Gammaproteobacteria bacterium]
MLRLDASFVPSLEDFAQSLALEAADLPAHCNPPRYSLPDAQPPYVRNKCRRRHYSIRIERAYREWVKRFVLHGGKKRPRDMGAREVEACLTHLAVKRRFPRRLSPSRAER